ncbi:MAG: alpha/beta fold hydrolase [Chlamydiota bacterium]|nr:alpha/beta fold hydrolase [Chlamydiota bacterium]
MLKLYMVKFFIFCFFMHLAFADGACNNSENLDSLFHREGVVDVENGKLYYQTFGQGTPIIVLHGGPGLDQNYLLPQLLHLASDNQLILYDQRGSGRSLDTGFGSEYINIDQFVDDLEILRQSLGIDKFVLLGHSWGGFLGMKYAMKYQDHLSGLILLNSVAADYRGQHAFVDEFYMRTKPVLDEIKDFFTYEDFIQLDASQITKGYKALFSVYLYDPQMIDKMSLSFDVKSAQGGVRVREEMAKTAWMQPGIDLLPSLKKLELPTFILHGKQDIVPVWAAEEIHKAIPNSEIVLIDKCGHFAFLERPLQFNAAVHRFLRKIDEM